MRILQIISGRDINGALIYCKILSQRLRDLGHDVTVLVRQDSWLVEQLKEAQIPFLTSSMNRFPTSELNRVAKWIRENRIDLVHTHMSRGHAFGVLLKMFTGVPVVATAHSRTFQIHWRMNDFVIANSESTADYQNRINRVSSSNMQTIHCFVDLERFENVTPKACRIVRRQLRLRGDEFVVGLVGDVTQRKGHIHLFRALRKIVDAVPNFKLVLLGRFHRQEAYTKRLRSILIENDLFCRTKWLGIRLNIQDFMSVFDLCVVPSEREPLGLVAIEAMACGTPVVAANVDGLPEIVQHETNGLLVPGQDSNALADAVIKLAHNQDLREQYGQTGREMVFERFDPATLTDKVIDVYEDLLSRKRAA